MVSGVFAKSGFPADGLGLCGGFYFSMVNAVGKAPQNFTRRTKMAFKGS